MATLVVRYASLQRISFCPSVCEPCCEVKLSDSALLFGPPKGIDLMRGRYTFLLTSKSDRHIIGAFRFSFSSLCPGSLTSYH